METPLDVGIKKKLMLFEGNNKLKKVTLIFKLKMGE